MAVNLAVDGVPYFDDLYLDLVVYPDGTIIVDDMDELEEALSKKDITQGNLILRLKQVIDCSEEC